MLKRFPYVQKVEMTFDFFEVETLKMCETIWIESFKFFFENIKVLLSAQQDKTLILQKKVFCYCFNSKN